MRPTSGDGFVRITRITHGVTGQTAVNKEAEENTLRRRVRRSGSPRAIWRMGRPEGSAAERKENTLRHRPWLPGSPRTDQLAGGPEGAAERPADSPDGAGFEFHPEAIQQPSPEANQLADGPEGAAERPADSPDGAGFEFHPKPKLTKLLHSLTSHAEHLSRLEKDIHANERTVVIYERQSLQVARETLEAADHALVTQIGHEPSELPEAEIQSAIDTIANSPWHELLQQLGLADDEMANALAERLSQAIAKRKTAEVLGSYEKLLVDIRSLREIVEASLLEIPSPGFVRQLLDVTYTFGLSVTIGGAAAAASAEAVGGNLAVDIVSGAIGALTTLSLTDLYRKASRELRARKLPLKKYHYELIEAILRCYIFLRGLSGPDPPRDDEIEAARSVLLSTEFLVGYVEQLAIALPGLERNTYYEILADIRRRFVDGRTDLASLDAKPRTSTCQGFWNAYSLLKGFSSTIDRI